MTLTGRCKSVVLLRPVDACSWDIRCQRYFEGGSSSVYLWDLEEGGFAGVVLLKKGAHEFPTSLPRTGADLVEPFTLVALPSATLQQGSWDSIHVFEVRERSRQAHYSLTSTILLWLGSKTVMQEGDGDVKLSGTMTRQASRSSSLGTRRRHADVPSVVVRSSKIRP